MLVKTIWRELKNYSVAPHTPLGRLKTTPIQITPKKFLTWQEIDKLDWGKYNNQVRFSTLHGLRWPEATALTSGNIRDNLVLLSM